MVSVTLYYYVLITVVIFSFIIAYLLSIWAKWQLLNSFSPSTFAIHSTIAIGTFSILHINSDTSRSPFNIINSFQNPYLTLNQVEKLYEEFAEEMDKTIDKDVIKDIYVQTNGYVKLI